MLNKKICKMMSGVLVAIMGLGLAGGTTAEAAYHGHRDHHPRPHIEHHHRYPAPPPAPRHDPREKYTEGDRNTAAIAGLIVGAIIGATAANNS